MRTIRNVSLALVAALPLTSLGADLGAAANFNAFVFGNASPTGGHSDGSLAVGGNLSGTYDAAQASASGSLGGQAMGLYVGGADSPSGSVNHGSSYTGNYSGSTNFNGGPRAATTSSMVADFNTAVSNLKAQSSAISSLANAYGNSFNLGDTNNIKAVSHDGSVSTKVGDSNNISINVQGFTSYQPTSGQSVYLFNMNADAFAAFNNMQITWTGLDSTHTLLVNVTDNGSGASHPETWVPKQQVSSADHYILYNFGTATSLSVGTNDSFNGSILAPYAAVSQYKNIQGNLIAASWTNYNSSELHFDEDGSSKFLGYVPNPVPEPGTWAVLGLGTAAMLRRRR